MSDTNGMDEREKGDLKRTLPGRPTEVRGTGKTVIRDVDLVAGRNCDVNKSMDNERDNVELSGWRKWKRRWQTLSGGSGSMNSKEWKPTHNNLF